MKRALKSDTAYLLTFFLVVIAIGTALLRSPAAWQGGAAGTGRLPLIDALFTSTSAVCVTGLTTVDTSTFTRFGQIVILALIQVGGLGIISFTSLMLVVPGRRLPFRRLRTVRSFSVEGVENDPAKIIRSIVLSTAVIEGLGTLALFGLFSSQGVPESLFTALFHSISAFCNAGFSTFPDSLERFKGQPGILLVTAGLIVTGGIGFIVLQDIARRVRGKKKNLSYHSTLMLYITIVLVLAGAAVFWFLERGHAFAGMSPLDRAANALFQSITPRTAGFNAVHQADLRQPSRFVTMLLMFVGGAPGSIAGGIKIATAYVVFMAMVKKANEKGEISAFRSRLSPATINSAMVYFIKAAFLVLSRGGDAQRLRSAPRHGLRPYCLRSHLGIRDRRALPRLHRGLEHCGQDGDHRDHVHRKGRPPGFPVPGWRGAGRDVHVPGSGYSHRVGA